MDKESVDVQSTATESESAAAASGWAEAGPGLHLVPLDYIFESAANARVYFNPMELNALADLIEGTGGINTVPGIAERREVLGKFEGFELVDGARRYRALKKLGSARMKLEIVTVADARERRRLAMQTRLGKVELTPMELCAEYHRMIDEKDYPNIRALANAFSSDEDNGYRTIVNIMSLNKGQPEVIEALESGEISREHAVLIVKEKPDDQIRLLGMCHEVETVTIGDLPEQHKVLISVKRLASIIQSQFREAKKEQADLFAEKEKDAARAKDKATSLEASADRLLEKDSDMDEQDEQDGDEKDEPVDSKYNPTPDEAYAGPDTQSADVARDYKQKERARIDELCEVLKSQKTPLGALRLALAHGLIRMSNGHLPDVCDVLGWPNSSIDSDWIRGKCRGLSLENVAHGLLSLVSIHEIDPKREFLIGLEASRHSYDDSVSDIDSVLSAQMEQDVIDAAVEHAVDGVMEGHGERWMGHRAGGLDDAALTAAIAYELGHGGGSTVEHGDARYDVRYSGGKTPYVSIVKPGELKLFKKVSGKALLETVRRVLEIDMPRTAKKARAKKLSADEIVTLGEDAVRTVFQNCMMDNLVDKGATDDQVLKWINTQIGDDEEWQAFPAGDYAGRVRAWLGQPMVYVYRTDKDAESNSNALFSSEGGDLVVMVRGLFNIPEPVKQVSKKAVKKETVKAPAKKAAKVKSKTKKPAKR